MTMIRKTFPFQRKTIDAEAGIYEAIISTEEVDRDGDIVRAAGADLTQYLLNPVVLAGHDYRNLDSVVGKALEVTVVSGQGIKARFQFAPADVNPKAELVRRLWASEFVNATSIGFIPKEAKPRENGNGYEFTSWELLEFSVVSVPSNQSALALRTLGELNIAETRAVNERALDLLREYFELDVSAALEKRGRVLSAANEQKLKGARDALNEVLAQLEQEANDGKAASNESAEISVIPEMAELEAAGENETSVGENATNDETGLPALSVERELANLLDSSVLSDWLKNIKESIP